MKTLTVLLGLFAGLISNTALAAAGPVRFAIVGLVHDHARGFIPSAKSRQDVQLVAIVEPNQDLARRYAETYGIDTNLFYTSLEEMLDEARVQAVATFTSTFDHKKVVEACAARGVHVMMEKPLAVSMEHAKAIESAAKRGRIEVLGQLRNHVVSGQSRGLFAGA